MFYSQFGEDEILFDVFKRKIHGTCVEVGANDGVNDSTTYFFEKLGWDCILVEPNPDLCKQIRLIRSAKLYEYAASNNDRKTTLYIAEGAERSHGVSAISDHEKAPSQIMNYGFSSRPVIVQTKTLDEILLDAEITSEIDFVSIDVEGHELKVLEGFTIEKWKPTVILIEDNSNFESTIVRDYLSAHGYTRFKRTGVNDWYSSIYNKDLVTLSARASYWLLAIKTKSIRNFRNSRVILQAKNWLKRLGVR